MPTADGESSWFKAHNRGEFQGVLTPFGSAVWYLPSPTRKAKSKGQAVADLKPKWAGKASLGIFAGYVMRPGGSWSGRYLVWPIEFFVGMDLSEKAVYSSEEAKRLSSPHDTARVDRCDLGVVFPLKIHL